MNEIIDKLKKDTNNLSDIIYRKKTIRNKDIWVIFNEPLVSSDKVSDFIFRSLNDILSLKTRDIVSNIENNIYNCKVRCVSTNEDMCNYLHNGFTIILVNNDILVLETKGNIKRSVTTPNTENSFRGPKDSFIEDYQTNIGLIKKRIKTNNLWIRKLNVGRYTNTQVGLLYINGICKKELVDKVYNRLKEIDIDGIISSGSIKNLIEKENKCSFPTTLTTERPDRCCSSLLEGKICIVVDNDPYVLVIPALLNDFFKTSEDYYSKSINASLTRIIRYIAFFIALFTPAIYIALITYNQEMIPTQLLISFSMQRSGVPFPAFFEAFIMLIAFEILKESDLRTPGFTGSSLSIVGALILGDAAVAAGIVSPIMIIVISITSISSLPFNEYEIINGLRWYRIIFMLSASLLGIIGVVFSFIYFLINMAYVESYGKPYLTPYAPTYISGIKDSLIKFNIKSEKYRPSYLSNNHKRSNYEN